MKRGSGVEDQKVDRAGPQQSISFSAAAMSSGNHRENEDAVRDDPSAAVDRLFCVYESANYPIAAQSSEKS
jgi:hypothetical protein